ncbi:MAG: hypothetical protein DMD43_10440 [Gemmatimonadetes bacterium]|nr:MAG: hypothetical protein DMD43_10440 [Gemmatimonadota bacterium]
MIPPVVALTAATRSGNAAPLVTSRLPAGMATLLLLPVSCSVSPAGRICSPRLLEFCTGIRKLPSSAPVAALIRWIRPVVSLATHSVLPSNATSTSRPLLGSTGLTTFHAIAADVPPGVCTLRTPLPATGSVICTTSLSTLRPNTLGPVFVAVSTTVPPSNVYVLLPSRKPAPRSSATFVPTMSTALSVGTICSSGWLLAPSTCSGKAPLYVPGTTSTACVPATFTCVGVSSW